MARKRKTAELQSRPAAAVERTSPRLALQRSAQPANFISQLLVQNGHGEASEAVAAYRHGADTLQHRMPAGFRKTLTV